MNYHIVHHVEDRAEVDDSFPPVIAARLQWIKRVKSVMKKQRERCSGIIYDTNRAKKLSEGEGTICRRLWLVSC